MSCKRVVYRLHPTISGHTIANVRRVRKVQMSTKVFSAKFGLTLKEEGKGTRNGYEASKGSRGISGL